MSDANRASIAAILQRTETVDFGGHTFTLTLPDPAKRKEIRQRQSELAAEVQKDENGIDVIEAGNALFDEALAHCLGCTTEEASGVIMATGGVDASPVVRKMRSLLGMVEVGETDDGPFTP